MFDLLDIAEERGRRRLEEAAAERMRPQSRMRHSLAVLLRRAADRLEPAAPRRGPRMYPVS
jgi:hypothetical protein